MIANLCESGTNLCESANNKTTEQSKNNLVYPELSYKIMGMLFKIHNKLGSEYQEKYYQRAIEVEFKKQEIPLEKEKLVKLQYENQSIGRYFIDFVIDRKIALEVKTSEFFKRDHINQVLAYLNSTNLKLAILVNFHKDRLVYKRIINPKVKLVDH